MNIITNMQEKLALLYPNQASEVYQKLRQILDDFKRKFKSYKTLGFSEKDVVLICYADHASDYLYCLDHDRGKNGKLEVLHKFLNKYVKGLINKIHLLPFYPYSSDDGFSVIDYYQVRQDLGDWGDIKALSEDFGLMFDLVLNHVSAKSQWFKGFLAGDLKYKDYFIAYDKKIDTSSVYRPRTHPLLIPFQMVGSGDGVVTYSRRPSRIGNNNVRMRQKYLWTTFSPDQIDLNYKNPEVLLEMIKILLFYISQGASVIRLDAVRYLWKELGTSCVDLPQTHTIIGILRQIIEEIAPYVWLITEINGPYQVNMSYFGNGFDEARLIYNFTLPPLILYSFLKEDVSLLSNFVKVLKPPSAKTAFLNFTASHDGIGLMSLTGLISEIEVKKLIEYILKSGGKISYKSDPLKGQVPYELNITYLSAMGEIKKFLASQAILLSLQGVPAVYFNSLFGVENWQEGVKKLGYNRVINRQKFDYQELVTELDDKHSVKYQVYSAYKKLLQIRINEPLFSPLAGQEIVNLHPQIFAVVRFDGGNKLLCLVNISNQKIEIETNTVVKILGKENIKDLISREEIELRNRSVMSINPYQSFWLK